MALTPEQQAILFASRERTAMWRGRQLDIPRTHQIHNEIRTLAVTDATNATPIVITTAAHGLTTGMTVTITGVTGNTAANTTATVTVLSLETYELDGTVGNGAYIDGGLAVNSPAMPSIIPVGSFRYRDSIVTFKTRIRSTASSGHAGNIFSYGDATGAVAAWVDGQLISFRAGDATVGTDASIIQLDLGASPPTGWEATLVVMVRPDGLVGLWAPDFNLKIWSTGVDLGSFSVWTNDVAGNFAQAGTAMPADVTETGDPTSFDLIEPLSVYYGSFPRINIGANQI